MTVSAKVIEDSTHNGKRITTMVLVYQRFIHSEFMTHRMFSRNASSSRAIPVKKMLAQVWSNPAMPVAWGKNQAGMQAKEDLKGFKLKLAKLVWKLAGKSACVFAWALNHIGLHKQLANRLLEPWQYIHVVVTATEWDNFFELRAHPDAQPEIQELAHKMQEAMAQSIPKEVGQWGWHLPFVSEEERLLPLPFVKLSAARCARVSYLTHEGKKPDLNKDLELFDRLVGSSPMHASPIEHQAYALTSSNEQSGNFVGWKQYRKVYEVEGYRDLPR